MQVSFQFDFILKPNANRFFEARHSFLWRGERFWEGLWVFWRQIMPLGRIGSLCVALSCGFSQPALHLLLLPHRLDRNSSPMWLEGIFISLLVSCRLLPKLSYNFGSVAAGWSVFAFKLQTNHRRPLIYSGKSSPQLKIEPKKEVSEIGRLLMVFACWFWWWIFGNLHLQKSVTSHASCY